MSDFLVRIRAVPNAKKTQIVGILGDALKIKIQAVPENGRANAELVGFLSENLGLPARNVSVVSGQKSRDKILRIDGMTRERAEALLKTSIPPCGNARTR